MGPGSVYGHFGHAVEQCGSCLAVVWSGLAVWGSCCRAFQMGGFLKRHWLGAYARPLSNLAEKRSVRFFFCQPYKPQAHPPCWDTHFLQVSLTWFLPWFLTLGLRSETQKFLPFLNTEVQLFKICIKHHQRRMLQRGEQHSPELSPRTFQGRLSQTAGKKVLSQVNGPLFTLETQRNKQKALMSNSIPHYMGKTMFY